MFEIGSLIKHQLVAHLVLGIALRSVLDSLRKSVDSKVSYHYLNLCVFSIVANFYVNFEVLLSWMFADVYVRYSSSGAVHGPCNRVATILQPYIADFTSSWNSCWNGLFNWASPCPDFIKSKRAQHGQLAFCRAACFWTVIYWNHGGNYHKKLK